MSSVGSVPDWFRPEHRATDRQRTTARCLCPASATATTGQRWRLLGIGNGGMLQGSGVVGDAATGAALGAAGGAIAGDAGKGAAIGAVASTLFGAFNRATDKPAPAPQAQVNAYQQQQQAAAAQNYNQRLQMNNEYNRAFGTCMTARNYTVN